MLHCFYYKELGEGWGPSFLETKEEYDFISHIRRNDPSSPAQMYVGGSRYPFQQGAFNYNSYRPFQTGKENINLDSLLSVP